jgi:acetoin utilization deacetylase AcuC-like enzyme
MLAAYLSHPECLLHDMGTFHPECAARITAIADRLLASGLLDFMTSLQAPVATREQIVRAHSTLHYETLRDASPAAGMLAIDPDTSMNAHTLQAALHAAGAVVAATELVVEGRFKRAFCNVRPPGHHAESGRAMGFCFFNNVAIGIRHALDELGIERVALIDFDVHHGNGSEEILAGDDRVLMVSTFESHLYPFSGEQPLGPNCHNVPLAPYSDGAALRRAVSQTWLPAIDAFEPQLVFVSAGFDAHREDDISHLAWRDADYAWVSRTIVEIADRHAHGRIVSSLEGGYSLPALARSVELHVRALLGLD